MPELGKRGTGVVILFATNSTTEPQPSLAEILNCQGIKAHTVEQFNPFAKWIHFSHCFRQEVRASLPFTGADGM